MASDKKTDQTVPNQRRKLIDEFVLLDAQVDAFKHIEFRHRKVRELILGWYPHLAPEDEAILSGTDWDILLSSRDRIRSVTQVGKKRLFKLWGTQEFIERATVLLKQLPDPADAKGLYTAQALTGPRHLHVVQKAKTPIAGTPAKPVGPPAKAAKSAA